eukprot:scaffold7154_cov186-Amphora_coffeaeformis.AAC.1
MNSQQGPFLALSALFALLLLLWWCWCPSTGIHKMADDDDNNNHHKQASSSPSCLLVKDMARHQTILMEPWGTNAVR